MSACQPLEKVDVGGTGAGLKVAFILPSTKRSSACRFRVRQYLRYLESEKIAYRLFFPRTRGFSGLKLLSRAELVLRWPVHLVKLLVNVREYDVIFIQRYIFSAALPVEMLLRLFCGKKIIVDFDDAVYLSFPRLYSLVVRLADAVIAGNMYLAEYARRYNSNVAMIPTAVNTERYRPKARGRGDQPLCIGWVGSPSGLNLLRPLYKPLQELAQRVQYRLLVVSNFTSAEKVSIPGVDVVNEQWSEDKETDYFDLIDIGLMPLTKDPWSDGKCSFKALQYMAAGIPAVVAAVGNNVHVINDGVDGYLYDTEEEFLKKMASLIEDVQKRSEMGMKARDKIEQEYATPAIAKSIIRAILA